MTKSLLDLLTLALVSTLTLMVGACGSGSTDRSKQVRPNAIVKPLPAASIPAPLSTSKIELPPPVIIEVEEESFQSLEQDRDYEEEDHGSHFTVVPIPTIIYRAAPNYPAVPRFEQVVLPPAYPIVPQDAVKIATPTPVATASTSTFYALPSSANHHSGAWIPVDSTRSSTLTRLESSDKKVPNVGQDTLTVQDDSVNPPKSRTSGISAYAPALIPSTPYRQGSNPPIYTPPRTSDVWVNSYIKKDGTVVQGHYRTAPNRSKADNFSAWGNLNPYTGKRGTKK